MKIALFPVIITLLLLSIASEAQIGLMIGPRIGYGYATRRYPRKQNNQKKSDQPKFEPYINLSLGYGFPNLDKYQLPNYFSSYQGNITQSGPITGAIDYRFSRMASIGLLVTHGKVSTPYFGYNSSSSTPDFIGLLDCWSIMINYISYMPVTNDKIEPYFRTAIGVNIWNQSFTDNAGNPISMAGTSPSDLAYQLGLGAKFHLTKKSGLFIEGGYGKYILQAGLTFKF